jgi:hypothetical protein
MADSIPLYVAHKHQHCINCTPSAATIHKACKCIRISLLVFQKIEAAAVWTSPYRPQPFQCIPM